MKEEKEVKFTQKWIEDAVKKLFPKEEIYESDMEKIKYLRIGNDFNNGYMIETSMGSGRDPISLSGSIDDLARLKQFCCWMD